MSDSVTLRSLPKSLSDMKDCNSSVKDCSNEFRELKPLVVSMTYLKPNILFKILPTLTIQLKVS